MNRGRWGRSPSRQTTILLLAVLLIFTLFIPGVLDRSKKTLQGGGAAQQYSGTKQGMPVEKAGKSPQEKVGNYRQDRVAGPGAPGTEKTIMAYYDKGWNSQTQGLPSFRLYYRQLDILSPNWYGVNDLGEVVPTRGPIEQEVYHIAVEGGLKLMPLITNYRGGHQFLISSESRGRAAANIVDLVIKNGYQGVNIDFELVPAQYSDEMVELIKTIYGELKPRGKLLAISVLPKVNFPGRSHGAHDYKNLSLYSDYICLMAYDKHDSRTAPGPVAPLGWVEDNIKYALSYVPSKKLILSLSAYGYDWCPQDPGAQPLGTGQAVARAEKYGSKIIWDRDSCSSYFVYYKDGCRHQVFFEDSKSAAFKVALAKNHKLAGIAFWRLGYENPKYFKVLN